MARRRPLFIDTDDGAVKRLDPSFDVLDAKIEAADILNLGEAIDDRVAQTLKDSSTIVWSYQDAADTLYAEIRPLSLTNDHVATAANIAWSKIDKTGSNLADLTTRAHQDLQNVQGGTATEQYHLTQAQHDTLTTGADASALHHHDGRYYTEVELQTPGQAQVHWDNVTNKPATYPPAPHTHPSTDVTDFTEAAQDAVGQALSDSDTVELLYADDTNQITAHVRYQTTDTVALSADASGLKADVRLTASDTVELLATADGLRADVRPGSLTNDHLSTTANIAWSKIDKTGSRLQDLANVTAVDAHGIVYDAGTDTWQAVELLTTAHRTATPLDHPDGSVTEPKLADDAVTARVIAANVDVSTKGFNADKVDGKDVNDAASDDSSLWTAAKIISYVDACVYGSTSFQQPVKDKDLCTPPASPATGDRYLVCASGATDAWAGHENEIAEWDGSTWVFSAPSEGWVVWVEDEDTYYIFNGSAWTPWSANIDHETLQNLQGGTTNEHYHLTAAQHTKLTAAQNADDLHHHAVLRDAGTGTVRFEVTDTFLDAKNLRLTNLADPTADQDAVNRRTLVNWRHNDLQGLQGGDAAGDEYYHLTLAQYERLAVREEYRFGPLTVVAGSYLKTGYPMLADKAFVDVYEGTTRLDPAQWDFVTTGPSKMSRLPDITDTIRLAAPNTAATYTVVYRERVTPYRPRVALYRPDGQEFTLKRIPVVMTVGATHYYLAQCTFDPDTAAANLTYVDFGQTHTRPYTVYVATHAYVQDFPVGATLPPTWRVEVWRSHAVNPRRRRHATSGIPRLATTTNSVPLLDLGPPSRKTRGGVYHFVLRETTKNIVTLASVNRVVVHHRRLRTLDGFAVIGWYWQPRLN